MAKATDAILRLVKAGAHVEVDGSRATDSLVSIAKACKARGVTLKILNGSVKATDSLEAIVTAGGGCVTVSGL